MKINKRILYLSFIISVLFISSLIFKYNDYRMVFITLLIISILLLGYVFYLEFYKTSIDKNKQLVKKILNEYEKIIVYVDDIDYGNSKIKHLNDFKELVKISEEIKKPILYYKNGKENIFLINDKEIYLFKIEVVGEV